MGIRSQTKLDPSSNLVRVLIDMYVEIGDEVARQYGGSEAHKKVTATASESNIAGPIGKVRISCIVIGGPGYSNAGQFLSRHKSTKSCSLPSVATTAMPSPTGSSRTPCKKMACRRCGELLAHFSHFFRV